VLAEAEQEKATQLAELRAAHASAHEASERDHEAAIQVRCQMGGINCHEEIADYF
jgi:hypothetical protein